MIMYMFIGYNYLVRSNEVSVNQQSFAMFIGFYFTGMHKWSVFCGYCPNSVSAVLPRASFTDVAFAEYPIMLCSPPLVYFSCSYLVFFVVCLFLVT